jgi:hypothetical protein
MSTNYTNADSLLYLQECINDLQNRFYGLQLEHMQKQEHQKMLQQLPSLNNSIWSTQSPNPYRPPSASSSSSSTGTTSTDRDSGNASSNASMRSFSPDISAASVAQLNAAAAFWPQAAATAATLAAFMPKTAGGALTIQPEQMEDLFIQQKPKIISPIGTGKPRAIGHFQQHQQQQQQQQQHQFNNYDQRQNGQYPFNKHQNRKVTNQKKGPVNAPVRHQKQPEKPKQGPFNKVLIVGLAPEYRSLNGVLDIFRPYGDVVSARVYRPFLTLPPEITRWVPSIELQGAYCAVIEYPTARCAKFAVGVLRERVTTNKYRVVLLKPGAYEELQRQQTLIVAAATPAQKDVPVEETQSDSGNESFENRSSRSSDCHSD